jgi:hypothetical protein
MEAVFSRRRQPLNGHNLIPFSISRKNRTGLHRQAIQNNRARPTIAGEAADVSSSETEMIAQEVNQQRACIKVCVARGTVHRHMHCCSH